LTGIEIKTSVSDWNREIAKPEKSVAIQKYCRHWYIAAPKGIVDVSAVPPTWGLLECNDRGVRATKNAPILEPQPIDMLLLCSILRNVARATVPKSQVQHATNEQVEALIASRVKSIEYAYKTIRDNVAAFEKASGVKVDNVWDSGRIGKAVKFVKDCGIENLESRLRGLHDTAKQIAKAIKQKLEAAQEATP